MNKNIDKKLYDVWDERWKGSDKSERITFLGRRMFKSKITVIHNVVKDLTISSVIEVGCGLGYTLMVYQIAGYKAVGIDVSQHAIDVCQQKELPVKLQKLENVTEHYDLVSCDGMLEHFLHFEPYARHLMRISRNYVLLIQPNHDSFTGKTIAYAAELLRGNENVFEYNYRIKDFISVFANNEFEIVKNVPIFFDVFRLLLFQKTKRETP